MSWDKNQFKKYDTSEGYGNRRNWQNTFNNRMGFDEADAIIKNQKQTPWEILGLSEGATSADIKRAYRKLAMQWHPDRNPDKLDQAEAMMKKINAAYTILSN